jgi:hypothetical protein
MRLFVVCVLATSVMGCSFAAAIHHRTARPEPSCGWLAAGGAADLATVGAIGAVFASTDPSSMDAPSYNEAVAMYVVASVLVVTGIESLDASLRCHVEKRKREQLAREDAANDAALQQRVAVREQAWKLTVEAETAARAGNCPRVVELDPQIAAIDGEMHDVVFARDVAVSQCRAAIR